jgi:archaemetzincin
VDLYVSQLNFVFGEAAVDGRISIISLYRLRPEYYGTPQNGELLTERAVKEAIHELGHTFGLHHCPDPRCVMCFSNSIADTDRKSAGFRGECAEQLRSKLQSLKKA